MLGLLAALAVIASGGAARLYGVLIDASPALTTFLWLGAEALLCDAVAGGTLEDPPARPRLSAGQQVSSQDPANRRQPRQHQPVQRPDQQERGPTNGKATPSASMMAMPLFQRGSSWRSGGTPRRPAGLRFHQIHRPLAELSRIARQTASISNWLPRPKSLPSCSTTPICTLLATAL